MVWTGLSFNIGCFTNLTHDHLDYHKTFENYLMAKKAFFDNLCQTAVAVVNIDDPNSGNIVADTSADVKKCTLNGIAG